LGELLKSQVNSRLGVVAFKACSGIREEKDGRVVMPIEHEAAAEDFVALGVRGVPKLLGDLEMGLFDADGSARRGTIFQQEQVPPMALIMATPCGP
jgi:hypothetical protein